MRLTTFLLTLAVFVLAGCRQPENAQTNAEINIELRVEDDQLFVGEARLIATVSDSSGSPINDAKVSLRGDMNHAGMAPVIRDVDQGQNGEYAVPFEWTMGGDWFVEVTVTLSGGETAQKRFDFTILAQRPPVGTEESQP